MNKGHGAVVSTCMLGLHPTALLEVPLTKHVSCCTRCPRSESGTQWALSGTHLDEEGAKLQPLHPFRER